MGTAELEMARDEATAADAAGRRERYNAMLEIRLFEDKVQELFIQGHVQGTTHLCQGQEGTVVGAVSALSPEDYLTITYRGHGHALARGVSMKAAFAELMGRAGGCCRGIGGSMHFTDFSRGLLGAFAIVGAGLPVALGAAMSSKRLGQGRVAASFCGDGATNIGTFHETLNMAAVWKAPVVFVVENNLYGEYTPMRATTPIDDIADRAGGYGMPGIVVDGQDVEQVRRVMDAAVARARAGEGPSLLECKTYRYAGHSRSDPARYRPEGELDRWRARDPLALLGAQLVEDGIMSEKEQAELFETVQAEVDRVASEAATEQTITIEEMQEYVYAG